MIVKLQRPANASFGPWLLYAPGVADFIEPDPGLSQRMVGEAGYFHAEQSDDGEWTIGSPAPPQRWEMS
ncbi:MAG: hypothetical protein Q7T61_18995 [Caulobacter sp.]|nr:hypothetical protein [Caulobacter sp.]